MCAYMKDLDPDDFLSFLRDAGLRVPGIAGGASLNERAAREPGADLYARDAMDASRSLDGPGR